MLRRERGLEFLDDENLPLLPEWRDDMRQLDIMRGQIMTPDEARLEGEREAGESSPQ